ncbi:hypothetical protein [Corynebacterium sp. ES2775-CONJ]|uniref:hypothetical protein n=1 Tax=Corynebacterium sp. ES2775-CONJ TaxID=2974029 RepID=UPI002167A231|nr:hypothetical protein [Corynebacterium sp. ES2775-CONJ]MCS4490327.1 hypothetical protein [Corynebacterium sp. ES2775-CONJ]
MTTTMINDLRTRRAETWEKIKAFLEERQSANNGILTAEDDETYGSRNRSTRPRDCAR